MRSPLSQTFVLTCFVDLYLNPATCTVSAGTEARSAVSRLGTDSRPSSGFHAAGSSTASLPAGALSIGSNEAFSKITRGLDEGDREFLGISSAQLAVEAERKKLEQQPRGPYLVRISRTATVREATKTVQETLRKIQLEERDELGTGIKGGSAVGKLESKTGPTSQSPAPHDHPTAKRLYGVFIDDISRVCAELIPSETGEAEELHASSLPRTEPSPASLKNPRPESRGQRRGRVGFTIDGEVESTAAIDSSIGQNSSLDLRLHDSLSCTTTDKTLPVSSQGVGLKKADTTLHHSTTL